MSAPPMKWKKGQQAELAARCKISRQYLNDVIRGRRRASAPAARNIERESSKMEGIYLSRLDVIYPEESTNPLITAL